VLARLGKRVYVTLTHIFAYPLSTPDIFLLVTNHFIYFSGFWVRFLGSFAKLRKANISPHHVCLSTRGNSVATGRIFIEFTVLVFLENLSRKFNFHWNMTLTVSALYKDVCTLIISHCVLLRTRNISDNILEEIKNTYLSSVALLGKSCRLWDNVEKYFF